MNELIEKLKRDLARCRNEVKRMKEAAEKHLYDPTSGIPMPCHWGEFPGETRACFTKTICSEEEGGSYYHLSVSTPHGKVSDGMVFMLLHLFGAPSFGVTEVPATLDQNVRHFMWPAETGPLN